MFQRLMMVTGLTLVMVVFGASVALAGACYIVSKPAGAGTHVTVDGEELTGLTPSGRLRGGFINVERSVRRRSMIGRKSAWRQIVTFDRWKGVRT